MTVYTAGLSRNFNGLDQVAHRMDNDHAAHCW